MATEILYLDQLPGLTGHVGYGELGRHGALGYEGQTVRAGGRTFAHALSAHAPSRLQVPLGNGCGTFVTEVTLADDVPAGASWADFLIYVDGRLCALEHHVRPGQAPRRMEVTVAGARELELVIATTRWAHCHSVWLDPHFLPGHRTVAAGTIADPLGRVGITLSSPRPRADHCIATIVSAGWEGLLEEMLASLAARGGCPDALLAVFAVDAGEACERVARDHGAHVVRCHRRAAINSMTKSALYSVARVIDAKKFICLDADMLVLDSLAPVFAALDAAPAGSILACREANGPGLRDLNHAVHAVYGGSPGDLARITGAPGREGGYDLVVNDGLFAGDRSALLALDGLLDGWPAARAWIDERRDIWWRNQFVFNLALARLQCGVELDPACNIQLNSQEVVFPHADTAPRGADWHGRPARVLHFNGNGRRKYLDWRARFHGEVRATRALPPATCSPFPAAGPGPTDARRAVG